jgi:hypothetical protein
LACGEGCGQAGALYRCSLLHFSFPQRHVPWLLHPQKCEDGYCVNSTIPGETPLGDECISSVQCMETLPGHVCVDGYCVQEVCDVVLCSASRDFQRLCVHRGTTLYCCSVLYCTVCPPLFPKLMCDTVVPAHCSMLLCVIRCASVWCGYSTISFCSAVCRQF